MCRLPRALYRFWHGQPSASAASYPVDRKAEGGVVNGEQTFNFNRKCLQEVTGWGENIFYNVCSNSPPVHVPWGIMPWVGGLVLFLMLGALIVSVSLQENKP
jgi:hypothetical protein